MEVELRLCRTDAAVPPALRARYRALLSPPEAQRWERLREPLRTQMEITRALVRTTLARRTGADPAALAFDSGPHGKPVLSRNGGPYFNVSHCQGWIALAVCDTAPVGGDLETSAAPWRDPLRLAGRFFTAEETQRLRYLPEAPRRELFLDLWTLKEAWVKAHGLPLAPNLSRIGFDTDGGRIAVDNRSDLAPGCFLLCRPAESLRLSLCQLVENRRPQITLYQGLPLASWEGPLTLPRLLVDR